MEEKKQNKMREIEIEKLILNCGGTEDKLEKSVKLLNILTGKKIKKVASKRRIPSFGVRPGLQTGCMVTIRGKEKEELLKRLLGAVNNTLKPKQVQENYLSFGVPEYLEIPDMEYQRDIGILGLDVTVVFKRKGKRAGLKKIKFGKVPKKQDIPQEEIVEFMKNKFNIELSGK